MSDPILRTLDNVMKALRRRRFALLLSAASAVSVVAQGPTASSAGAQPIPTTAPERTGYRETSRYAEVVRLMESAASASPLIHLTTFGYSFEGRALPLVVMGDLPDPSAQAVRASGRTVIYLQGNIHAGEVEGKEVLQILIREVAEGEHRFLLDSLVILVAPILNADGNERVTLTNRGAQYGPIGGVGTRANAQGLNINRDHMKLDSPEGRSFARLVREYDPHIAMDLHTTNGTRHAYHLTYAPPLHPNTHPGIVGVSRERLLPEVTRRVRQTTGWELYYYGNVQGQGEGRGWYTFDHRPRFNNNYLGLRNRIGLLSEAYSYATFEDRMTATRHFVYETLSFAWANATEIRTLVVSADAVSIVGERLALRATFERSAEPVEILMGGVVEEGHPFSGETILRRTDERRPERMFEFGTFTGIETEVVPRAYLVPSELTAIIRNLEAHGIEMTPVSVGPTSDVERYRIISLDTAEDPFEGRREQTLTGNWEAAGGPLPGGLVEVSMDQPLARLIFSLLEPRSDDGLANWGLMSPALAGAPFYPILRLR